MHIETEIAPLPRTVSSSKSPRIAAFATKGVGSNEELRIRQLLNEFTNLKILPFDRSAKLKTAWDGLRYLQLNRPDLLVMEGSGLAGGLLCLAARILLGVPYAISWGDAVGPWIAAHFPLASPISHIYERLLLRFAAGFIGWTPYLCGRALTFGCPRAVTAAGWARRAPSGGNRTEERTYFRKIWGIPEEAIVVGLVGSIEWNPNRHYCYGLELVSAAVRLSREDLYVLVVGGGSGLAHLRRLADEHPSAKICLPGPVSLEEVMPCLSAFDVASLPQSTDAVGSFRYTTKLSEYADADLPVITPRIPVAYDLGANWTWRLPGSGPWEEKYISALASLLENLDHAQIESRRVGLPMQGDIFDREAQIQRVAAFVADILEELEPLK
jgi:hypothetical protein